MTETRSEYLKQWRAANPERCRQNRDEWRKRHPGRHNELARARNRSLRMEVMAAYGGECACCAVKQDRFLTMDHVNGGGNKHRREVKNSSRLYAELKRNGFPAGFQVLCWNCNSGRALNGGICPHKEI